MIPLVVENHSYRAFPNFRRKLVRRLAHTGSTFSGVGASGKPGAVQIDFRHQQGIYILYDDYGPSYVGLTRDQGLGKRLKDHKTDHLKNKWDRFSWFGFRPLLPSDATSGVITLGSPQTDVSEDTSTTIGDLEALLIRAIGPKRNRQYMSFDHAERWTQIAYEDGETYLQRAVEPRRRKA